MNRQLVFIHGRAQEFKDAVQLKTSWIEAWRQGLGKSALQMPIAADDIRFPYYGQTLHDLVAGIAPDKVAEVIVRGGSSEDAQQQAFMRAVLEEIRVEKGISEDDLREVAGDEAIERGPLNWPWVRAIVDVLDKKIPGVSGLSVSIATQDVYQYLNNPGVTQEIEDGVRAAITPGVPTVVVAHSLGSVVAYRLLTREGEKLGWDVPLFVTVGCPLAVTAIAQKLRPMEHPRCAKAWDNAMDPQDIVALRPLDGPSFAFTPQITNKVDVDNTTENQHGISGYLSDPVVARWIYDALTA
jgi:hypothetical protein